MAPTWTLTGQRLTSQEPFGIYLKGHPIKHSEPPVKLKLLAVLVAAALSVYPLGSNPAAAQIKSCQVFNFKALFIADYSTGSKWDNSNGNLQITWSARSPRIYDENTVRPFTDSEMEWIRTAIKSWDNALATVSFREASSEDSPQITIGYVELKPAEVQLDAMGFWNTWVESGVRYRATIKLKSSEVRWFSSKNQFIQTVQHELGNALGLGDLKPSTAFVSVLEDPWQPPYGQSNLSSTDVAMIRQLYGESTCTKKLQTKK